MPTSVTRKAFSLIELLVVISIISLLIAILIPSLQNARGVARRTLCLSNQKQLHVAASVYASDHRNAIPYSRYRNPGNQPGEPVDRRYTGGIIPNLLPTLGDWDTAYLGLLATYTNQSIPAADTINSYGIPVPRRIMACTDVKNADLKNYWPSIGLSTYIAADHYDTAFGRNYRFEEIRRPTQIRMLGDRAYQPDDLTGAWDLGWGGFNHWIAGTWWLWAQPRHLKTINVIYVDGHGKAEAWGALDGGWTGTSDNPWYPQ